MNRLAAHIEEVRVKCDALPEAKRQALEETLAVSFEEHFRFQETQARAHAGGKLSTDEAMIVYRALGELGSDANGGWANGTDLATKVSVTLLMGELL